MEKQLFVMPQIVEKSDYEWVCLLSNGKTIKMMLEFIADNDDDDNYVYETIEITFWENDEQLGTSQDYFEFTRNGYVAGIENMNYLMSNIYLPSDLRGKGIGQLAIEFFKEFTNNAGIYARNPDGPKFTDGSELLDDGKKFVKRMQALSLIKPHDL